jgi:cytochrome b561
MQRYHPLLVALHWIMAVLILLALFFGKFVLSGMPLGAEKFEALAGHMSIGIAVGVLLVIRLITRFTTTAPPHASTGNGMLDRIGVWTHYAFYILIAGMVLTGAMMGFGAGLFPVVFGGAEFVPPVDGRSGPPDFSPHGMIATVLAALIFLHIAAALYHQIIVKDRLLSRMWFGRSQR